MKRLRGRPSALILLLALIGAGLGLPLADALIFHGTPGARPAAERILTGGPQAANHVQLCSLEQTTGTTKATLAAPVCLATRLEAPEPTSFRDTNRPFSRPTHDTSLPRAPPSA